jgi:hypothetical protein
MIIPAIWCGEIWGRSVSREVKSFMKFPPGALLSLGTMTLEGII